MKISKILVFLAIIASFGFCLISDKEYDQLINKSHCVIFSKSYCPFCKRAKNLLLDQMDVDCTVFELNEMGPKGNEIQATLKNKTGQRTVPNIFFAGKSYGGSSDVQDLFVNGMLQDLAFPSEVVEHSFKEDL